MTERTRALLALVQLRLTGRFDSITVIAPGRISHAAVIRACGELPRQAGEIFPNSPDMKPSIPPALITLALVCFALALHITCH
jgi:hypothetical protein